MAAVVNGCTSEQGSIGLLIAEPALMRCGAAVVPRLVAWLGLLFWAGESDPGQP